MSDRELEYTINLPLRTVVGCGLLLAKQGQDPKDVTEQALVTLTLISMVEWFDKKRWISLPPDEELENSYDKLFGIAQPTAGEDFRIGGLADQIEERVQAKLSEKELETAKRSTAPTEVPDVQKPGKTDLMKVNRMDIAQLQMLSPKDTLIDKVIKGLADPIYRAAVEIVYTSLPAELWGTPTAEQAINDMVMRHEVAQ
jgi:hypothetical protein